MEAFVVFGSFEVFFLRIWFKRLEEERKYFGRISNCECFKRKKISRNNNPKTMIDDR